MHIICVTSDFDFWGFTKSFNDFLVYSDETKLAYGNSKESKEIYNKELYNPWEKTPQIEKS